MDTERQYTCLGPVARARCARVIGTSTRDAPPLQRASVGGLVLRAARPRLAGERAEQLHGAARQRTSGLGDEELHGVALAERVRVVACAGGNVSDARGAVEGAVAVAALLEAEDAADERLLRVAEGDNFTSKGIEYETRVR